MHAQETEIAEVSTKPLVSVVIPTQNRARLVQEAIDSVLAQDGLGKSFDMEVIVVDDASTDETPEVASKYPEVRYLRLTTKHGEGGARNAGIKASRGKYIAFLDDDDLMLPERLKLQVPPMERHPEIGVVYSQNIIRGKATEKWFLASCAESPGGVFERIWPDAERAPSGDVFERFLKEEFVSADTLLVRRTAFDKAGFFNNYPTEAHYDMFLRLAFHVPFLFVKGNVAICRLNPAGVFHARLAGEEGCAKMLPKVVENALAMLPDSDYSRRLRREVHLALVPRIFCMLERLEAIEAKRLYVRTALQTCPWILRERPARALLVNMAYFFAAGSTWPIASVKAICREIKAAAAPTGIRESLQTRSLLADIWTEVSMRLGYGAEPFPRAAGYAAARAVLYDPTKLCRKVSVLLIFRAIMGPRITSFILTLLKGRLLAQAQRL
jgi:glycosyltransferase involved in cell wall biosynthesis